MKHLKFFRLLIESVLNGHCVFELFFVFYSLRGAAFVVASCLTSMHSDLFDLSSEIQQQKLWFFHLSEHFFRFVDLISEVDATVVETMFVVNRRRGNHTIQGTGGIPPQQLVSFGDRFASHQQNYYFTTVQRYNTMIGMMECDSFQEQDIDQLQAQLVFIDGPTLDQFQLKFSPQLASFPCSKIFQSLIQEGHVLRYMGNSAQAALIAFAHILLLIGENQHKKYPHLNTLIRQQFFKPYVFSGSFAQQDANNMLQKCVSYFKELKQGTKPQDYIARQPMFLQACLSMLKNSLQSEYTLKNLEEIYGQLSKKFNIELSVQSAQNQGSFFAFGSTKRYKILKVDQYFWEMDPNGIEEFQTKNAEQCFEVPEENKDHLGEVSSNSTPQFINSQRRLRKKSHKNSFGGDMDMLQYKDLLQHHRLKKTDLEDYLDHSELQSCAEPQPAKVSFNDIMQQNYRVQMKGSTTIQPTYDIKNRFQRKISSSTILQSAISRQKHEKTEEKELYQQQIQNKYKNQQESLDEPKKIKNQQKINEVKVMPMKRSLLKAAVELQPIQELQRMDEAISSQKQSTHIEVESQASQYKERCVHQSLVKEKDRKNSYFSQYIKRQNQSLGNGFMFKQSWKSGQQKQIVSTNLTQKNNKSQRFEENPLRMSNLITPSQQSQPTRSKMTLNSSVYDFQFSSQQTQPQWVKKEIIYYMANGDKEQRTFQKASSSQSSVIAQTSQLPMKQSLSTLLSLNHKGRFDHIKQRPQQFNRLPFNNRILSEPDSTDPPQEQIKTIVLNQSRSVKSFGFDKMPAQIPLNIQKPQQLRPVVQSSFAYKPISIQQMPYEFRPRPITMARMASPQIRFNYMPSTNLSFKYTTSRPAATSLYQPKK